MQSNDIEKIMKFIKDNIGENLTLKDIARHINYSKFHVSHYFKKHTGYSIKQYIEAVKIEKSIADLMEENNSVTEIAYDSGHKSPGTFSNVFKKHTGLSPKKYKSQSQIAYRFLKNWIKKKNLLTYYDKSETTDNKLAVSIEYPEDYRPKITCTGLFKTPIPKELPVVGIATVNDRNFVIENIPNGEYFLLICEIMEDLSLTRSYVLDYNFRGKLDDSLVFYGHTHLNQSIVMRRPIEDDPPITINLPVLIMKTFLQNSNL